LFKNLFKKHVKEGLLMAVSGTKEARLPSLIGALTVVMLDFAVILTGIIYFGLDPHIPIFIASIISVVYGFSLGYKWDIIETAIFQAISSALLPMFIILTIGMVIGTWVACGTVPYLIYWGLKLISPGWFLVTGAVMCVILSVSTGSSWTTMGTVGIALMGVGAGMGIPPQITAGMVVSGAFFGDKQSPLSDSTNFAAAVAGAPLYEHVSSMLYTTLPSLLISLVLYGVIGRRFATQAVDAEGIRVISEGLASAYNFNVFLIVPLIVLVTLIVRKVPALVGMSIAALLGMVWAMIFQDLSFGEAMKVMHAGNVGHTGVQVVDSLLTRGGFYSMLWTISLMFFSLAMAGVLESTGILTVVLKSLSGYMKTAFGAVTVTVWSAWILNFLAADPYLAMLLPAKTYGPVFDDLNLDRKVLSRTLEDGGTLICPMVPWGTSGVFSATVLGVATLSYAPYYFLGLLNPFVAMVVAKINRWGMFYKENKEIK